MWNREHSRKVVFPGIRRLVRRPELAPSISWERMQTADGRALVFTKIRCLSRTRRAPTSARRAVDSRLGRAAGLCYGAVLEASRNGRPLPGPDSRFIRSPRAHVARPSTREEEDA